MNDNLIFHGDNLEVMDYLLQNNMNNSIDLIYIDPPFATGNTFMISSSRANTISSSKNSFIAYKDDFSLDEYLKFIEPRLKQIHQLLSDQGSLYLHIDYKIGHYIKVMLDKIFGIENFRADISRIKCNPKNFKRRNYGNVKDMILFYSKTESYIWNDVEIKVSHDDIKKRYAKIDKSGRRYTTVPIHAPGETKKGSTAEKFNGVYPPEGRHWRYSVSKLEQLYKEGLIETSKTGNMRLINYASNALTKKKQDIWEYKDPQKPLYPTAKSLDLLNYIILNSSNKNSIVLDCFAGSGTTLLSAQNNNRRFIGIDNSMEAIKVISKRLEKYTLINNVTEMEMNIV